MPLFRYVARTQAGETVRGRLTAESAEAASRTLHARGQAPIAVALETEAEAPVVTHAPLPRLRAAGGRLSGVALARWLRALGAYLLETGSVDDALRRMAASGAGSSGSMRALQAAVARGKPLAEAMAEQPAHFDALAVELVRAGERSRRLGPACLEAAEVLEKHRPLTFRAIVFGSNLWSYFTIYLPCTLLIALVALLPVALVAGLAWLLRLDPVRRWHGLRYSLPILGPLYRSTCFSRFTQAFAACAVVGVPLATSVELSIRRMGDRQAEATILPRLRSVAHGMKVSEAFRLDPSFPQWVVNVIRTAEETGRMDLAAAKLTDYLQDDTEEAVDRSVGLLLWLLPALVGLVILALLLLAYLGYAGAIGIDMPGPGEAWRNLWSGRRGAGP
ncbi:MAG TPA: type II secretion system F family protein [Armatimonadota bacterium]|nr:type II secretion system F family protein [Armatimonadota bacterium]